METWLNTSAYVRLPAFIGQAGTRPLPLEPLWTIFPAIHFAYFRDFRS